MTGHAERIDFLFGNEEHYFMAARGENFCDGQSRKEMPTCSSACDNGIHLDSRRGPGSNHRSLLMRWFKDSLTIDVQKQSDSEQAGREVGPAIADERERQSFVRKQ